MTHGNDASDTSQITEQVVYIDTRDRNMKKVYNPFHFGVEFGSQNNFTDNIGIPLTINNMYYLRFRTIVLPVRLVNFPIDRYFILRIKELDIPFRYHSNPALAPSTDIILYNVGVNGPSLYLECRSDLRFPQGLGKRLQKLTFQFFDSMGRPLLVDSNVNHATPDDGPWNLVYKHLLPDNLLSETFPPETDPYQMLNNVLLEMHMGVTTR